MTHFLITGSFDSMGNISTAFTISCTMLVFLFVGLVGFKTLSDLGTILERIKQCINFFSDLWEKNAFSMANTIAKSHISIYLCNLCYYYDCYWFLRS